MNIGFDAKRLFLNYTGLGNYSRYIINGLNRYVPDNDYYLFSPKTPFNNETSNFFNHPNIHIVKPKGIFTLPLLSSIWRSGFLTRNDLFSKLHIYHGLSNELPLGIPKNIKKVVTIHDAIFLRFPQYYKPVDVRIYKRKMQEACKAADKIIAVSQQTANDIIQYFNINPDKIVVSYQGCHERFRQIVDSDTKKSIAAKYNLPSSFILNVGTIEERKNVHTLIEAVSMLSESEKIPIVIIGRKTAYQLKVDETIAKAKMNDLVHFIHRVDIADLPAIYQQSRVFVYPSLFEGFGIPIIEGIESGVPVITSTGSCFSEAGGPAAIYTDPKNTFHLAEALHHVLSSDNHDQIEDQMKYVQKFLPEKTTEDLFSIYKSLFSN